MGHRRRSTLYLFVLVACLQGSGAASTFGAVLPDYYQPPAAPPDAPEAARVLSPDGWLAVQINISCTVYGADPHVPVNISVGGGLALALAAGNGDIAVAGNVNLCESRGDQQGFSLSFTDPWDMFELADTTLVRVPLSYDPLISCTGCEHVHVYNTVLQHLYGSPDVFLGCDTSSYNLSTLVNRTVGALFFLRPRSLVVDGLTCTDVRNANDFSCLLLELGGYVRDAEPWKDPLVVDYVSIARSIFTGNSVKPGSCLVTSDAKLGLGAVTLHVPYSSSVQLRRVVLTEVTMTDNDGGLGAALALELDQNTRLQLGSLEIVDSLLARNSARMHGGAIYLGLLGSPVGLVRVAGSNLSGNIAGPGNGGNGGAFYCNTAIEQFLIEGGSRLLNNRADVSGGAIWMERGVRELAITGGSRVSYNTAAKEYGGGVYIGSNSDPGPHPRYPDAEAILIDGSSYVAYNDAYLSGGGLFINQNVGQFTVSGSSIVGKNRAMMESGGGIYVGRTQLQAAELRLNVGTLTISSKSWVLYNKAGVRGGGVYIHGSVDQGGIALVDAAAVDSNTVSSPGAEFGGGIGVCGFLSALTVADLSTINDNEVAGGVAGGGVWVNSGIGRISLTNGSTISDNRAPTAGAAIAVVGVEGPLNDAMNNPKMNFTVVTESILLSGGSCVCGNKCGYDDGVRVDAASGAIYLEYTRVMRFVVTDGSEISRNEVNSGDGQGAAVHVRNGIEYFSLCNGSRMNENTAITGGALFCPQPQVVGADGAHMPALGRFEMCGGAEMMANTAGVHGGAIFVGGLVGEIDISNSTIINNKAQVSGGAIRLESVPQRLQISDSVVINNTNVFDHGGFMYMTANVYDGPAWASVLPTGPYLFSIVRSNFSRNHAFKNGGVFAFTLLYFVPTLNNATKREQLLRERYVHIRISESNFVQNTANWGAGGAIAFLSLMPMEQDQRRPASVSLGTFIEVTKSTFHQNRCGDDLQQLSFAENVSPLQGIGGAIFVWATPFRIFDRPPTYDASSASPTAETVSCMQPEENLPPGIAAFGNASCWPVGSRTCAVLLDDVTMTSNIGLGGYGGAFTSAQCAVKVVRSRFSNNSAVRQGGAIAFMDYGAYSYLSLANFSNAIPVSDPLSAFPLPVSLWSGVPYEPPPKVPPPPGDPSVFRNLDSSRPLQQPWLVMYDTVLEYNTASDGGAVFMEVNRTSAVIVNCTFEGNKALGRAGGVLLVSKSTLAALTTVFRDTNFTDNTAGSDGGALLVQLANNKAATALVGCVISGNIATRGAGIYTNAIPETSLLLWGVTLDNNLAYQAGGGLFYEFNADGIKASGGLPADALLDLRACQLRQNTAVGLGGALFLDTHLAASAAAWDSVFAANTAVRGGALYLDASRGGDVRVSSCTMAGNKATNYGGAAYVSATCGGRLTVDAGSVLSDNTAGQYGGAVTVVNADRANDLSAQLAANDSAAAPTGNAAGSSSSSNGGGGSGGSGGSGYTAASAVCSSAGLVLSGAVLAGNSAQQGGAAFAYTDTVMFVTDSSLTDNTARVSGGAIAAVGASLLHVSRCNITDNLALLSGGGVFSDGCAAVLVEDGRLALNSAAAGGGLHVSGPRVVEAAETADTTSTATATDSPPSAIPARRQLLKGAAAADPGSSVPAAGTDPRAIGPAGAVALLSGMSLHGNIAASGLDLSDSDLATLSAASALLVERFTPYQGHGGGVFVSGAVGFAMAGTDTTELGNTADVGAVIASTQTCAAGLAAARSAPLLVQGPADSTDGGSGGAGSGGGDSGGGADSSGGDGSGDGGGNIYDIVAAQLSASSGGRWAGAAAALSWAAGLNCSLLVLQGTRLPAVPSTAPTPTLGNARVYSAAKMTAARRQQVRTLPLLWFQDLGVSSLEARCANPPPSSSVALNSTPAGASPAPASPEPAEEAPEVGLFHIITEGLARRQGQQPQPPPPPQQQQRQPQQSQLQSQLPAASSGATTATADSAPEQGAAAHALTALLGQLQACGDVPQQNGSDPNPAGTLVIAVPATHMRVLNFSGALLLPTVAAGGGVPTYLNNTGGRAFAETDIRALVVAPDIPFDLEVQLFDGLGQPVVTDTPAFDVSIAIRPTVASNDSTQVAILRSSDAVALGVLTSSRGVVAWRALELQGWPGQYQLEVVARSSSSANNVLPEIAPLTITLELLPCEMGQELDKAKDKDHPLWTGCASCRRDLVGLWTDRRLRLLPPLPPSLSPDTWVANLTAEVQDLTRSDSGETCRACCLSCPLHAVCPGGPLLVPTAGYWHSAPMSPLMHRCPQPSACGITVGGGGVDEVWAAVLKAAFNITDSFVTINTTSTPSLASGSGVILPSADSFLLAPLRRDVRSLLLGTCQHWWYDTFPPNQEAVLLTAHNVTLRVNMSGAPCYLDHQAALAAAAQGAEGALDRWYMQLQCATGYTGHLCAVCDPGYSLTVDFNCMACPPLARTVSVGLLAFWGTVALILFTAFSNLSKNRQQAMQMEELSALDLLKTLITHIQYFVIITKLGIDYPAIITRLQAVLSAVTGTENYIAYSPSCLFGDLDSAQQAAFQIGFGLCVPCVATLVSLLIWALRYFIANQSVFLRTSGRRWDPNELSDLPEVMSVGSDGAKCDGLSSRLPGFISEQGSCLPGGGGGGGGGGAASATVVVTQSLGLPTGSSVLAPPSSSRLDLSSSLPPTMSCLSNAIATPTEASVQPPRSNLSCGPPRSGLCMGGAGGGAGGGDLIAPATPFASTTTAALAAAAAAAAAGSAPRVPALNASPSIMHPKHIPQICIQLDDEDPPEPARVPAAARSQTTKSPAAPRTPLSAAALKAKPLPRHAPSPNQSPMPLPAMPALPSMPPTPPLPTHTGVAKTPPPPAAAAASPAGAPPPLPSQQSLMRAGPNPFAMAAPPMVLRDLNDPTSLQPVDSDANFFDANEDKGLPAGEHLRPLDSDASNWKSTLANVFANPGQWLMFADQAVPLLQQLEVVVIVASFILYPSLCQISLSLFACYKLDSGEGVFAENQQATWRSGYWVRNMQQECYTGLHQRVYVPIGIASVLLFCLVPPAVYFLLTFLSRKRVEDPRVRIQYGFLYLQYKPRYFWWSSMRQLQVLALVAVEVFGRALPVLQQALLLLAVLILIAGINTVNAPERFTVLMVLEFLSMCVLSMTLTLGLYFVSTDADSQLDTTSANIVGSIILVINAVFIVAVLVFMAKRSVEVARKMRRAIASGWATMVTGVSRAVSGIQARISERSATRRSSRLSLKLSGP